MKTDGLLKHTLVAFALAGLGYAIFYFGIEHRRNQKGPWQVIFTNSPAGLPSIVIDQPAIGVTNVWIIFGDGGGTASSVGNAANPAPGMPSAPSSNLPAAPLVRCFGQPFPVPYDVPFGKCVFMDTTFLPGSITFELFGHQIELLPRALIIDFVEHPWQSGAIITLAPSRPADEARRLP